jgi:hypothetical protein
MLKVEFYWPRAPIYSSMTRSEFLTKPPFLSNLLSGKTDVNLYHNSRGAPFRSGDSLTLQTNEPSDLPSFRLLTLQWHLSRLASMVGAAEILNGDDDDDDDDEGRDDWKLPASSVHSS